MEKKERSSVFWPKTEARVSLLVYSSLAVDRGNSVNRSVKPLRS